MYGRRKNYTDEMNPRYSLRVSPQNEERHDGKYLVGQAKLLSVIGASAIKVF